MKFFKVIGKENHISLQKLPHFNVNIDHIPIDMESMDCLEEAKSIFSSHESDYLSTLVHSYLGIFVIEYLKTIPNDSNSIFLTLFENQLSFSSENNPSFISSTLSKFPCYGQVDMISWASCAGIDSKHVLQDQIQMCEKFETDDHLQQEQKGQKKATKTPPPITFLKYLDKILKRSEKKIFFG